MVNRLRCVPGKINSKFVTLACAMMHICSSLGLSCGFEPVVDYITCLLFVNVFVRGGGKTASRTHTHCHAHKLNSADGKHETQINVVLCEDACQRAFSSWQIFLFSPLHYLIL